MKHILIKTDGYSINTTEFDTIDQAREVMATEYNNYKPNDDNTDDDWSDMSSLSDDDAILYTGDDVYVWKIISV